MVAIDVISLDRSNTGIKAAMMSRENTSGHRIGRVLSRVISQGEFMDRVTNVVAWNRKRLEFKKILPTKQ
jgi:hypothetical protein